MNILLVGIGICIALTLFFGIYIIAYIVSFTTSINEIISHQSRRVSAIKELKDYLEPHIRENDTRNRYITKPMAIQIKKLLNEL
jgi:uncharacterized protein (UPF0216 family)